MRLKAKGATILAFVLTLCVLGPFTRVHAAETPPNPKAVVFLLDASNSMNSNDKTRLAIDSIAQLIYSLPSDYTVGFVAYNTEVIQATAMVASGNRESVMTAANAVKYTGYTNAGAGLVRAVELLEEEGTTEKTIVILSDGEIVMGGQAATDASVSAFQTAANIAVEQKIKIHVVGLGDEMTNDANTIFSAATATGGINYHAPKATDIQNAVDSILLDQLNMKKTTSAIVNASGETESLTVTIPSAQAPRVRILFTSSSPIKNLTADFSAGSVKQFSGTHYSLLEIERPTSESVNVSFQGKAGSQVKVDVITEYALDYKVDIKYSDTIPEAEGAEYYRRQAHITLTFYDKENSNQQVLTDNCFHNLSIPLSINGEETAGVLKQGAIALDRTVTKDEALTITLDVSNLDTNLFLAQPLSVTLEGPPPLPPPPPPPDYRPLYIGLGVGGLALVAIILLAIRSRQRRKPRPIPEAAPPAPSKYSYSGKLNIYITRTAAGYDIPPISYNLFRLPSGRVISLAEILEECNVDERFEGATKIYFKSGAGRCLVISNNSDCTIMKNREILMKNRSYELPMDSKVDVAFEDEISELAFQYKDVKPSELVVGSRA